MEILLIIGVLAGMVGAVAQTVGYLRQPKQQALPAPAPAPQARPTPEAPIEGYHSLAEIWDYTLSGAVVPSPAADTQYAVKEPKPAHPRPPAGGIEVSSPVNQSFGHYGLDLSSITAANITAAKITTGRIYDTRAEITAIRMKIDELKQAMSEDSYGTRILKCDAYVRASPYRKSEYVRIANAWERIRVVGYVRGESYTVAGNSSDIWFVLGDGSVVWSHYLTDTSTSGLPMYTANEPDTFEQLDWSGNVMARTARYYKPYAA